MLISGYSASARVSQPEILPGQERMILVSGHSSLWCWRLSPLKLPRNLQYLSETQLIVHAYADMHATTPTHTSPVFSFDFWLVCSPSTKLFTIQCLKLGGQPTKGHSSWQWCVSTTAGLKYRLALSLSVTPPSLPAVAGYSSHFSFWSTPVSFFVCPSGRGTAAKREGGGGGGVVFRRQPGVPCGSV